MDKYKIYLNEEDHLKQYFLNIKLSDIVIDKLYKLIKENSDENTLLIFSSDHCTDLGQIEKGVMMIIKQHILCFLYRKFLVTQVSLQ